MNDPSAILTTYFRSQTSNFHKRATLLLSRGTGLLSGKSLYSVLDIIVWNYFSNHNEIANSKHLLYVTNWRMFHGVRVLHKSYNILPSTVSVINNKKQLGTVFMHNRKGNKCISQYTCTSQPLIWGKILLSYCWYKCVYYYIKWFNLECQGAKSREV